MLRISVEPVCTVGTATVKEQPSNTRTITNSGTTFNSFILAPIYESDPPDAGGGTSELILCAGIDVLGMGRYFDDPKRAMMTLPIPNSATKAPRIQPTHGIKLANEATRVKTSVPIPAVTAAT